MPKTDDVIAALEEKLKKAKARRQKEQARIKSAESKKERAKDTRRKILTGAVVLARLDRGVWPKDKFRAMMDDDLTRDDDRALFDLAPLPVNKESGQ